MDDYISYYNTTITPNMIETSSDLDLDSSDYEVSLNYLLQSSELLEKYETYFVNDTVSLIYY